MARRHIGSFELHGTGSATMIRASGMPPPASGSTFHPGRPLMVGPSHLPQRLTFACQAWDFPRILAEGWDTMMDSEEGHYITFRCWTACPLGDHRVDIRARAAARAGLQWAALPGGVFFTRGWNGILPAYWARR